SKIEEAGGVLVGGHSIEDLEMKYGLCVTGLIHPERIIRNNTVRLGDCIILTKPLGTGVITTAIKAEMASPEQIRQVCHQMSMLNKKASEIANLYQAHAMTDVTGFGFLGHLSEMTNPNCSIAVQYAQIAILDGALNLGEAGLYPGGSFRNHDYFSPQVEILNQKLSRDELMILYDAQTSGGLLISVPSGKAEKTILQLTEQGYEYSSVVGEVIPCRGKKILLY
ncbi:MAG: selenide, water dikinase SelD, partial [Candidatus Cloacimonetes bacterium]|nr:selenide, water dikinase SelD [Candidatus Cloacimonadota bacterium]